MFNPHEEAPRRIRLPIYDKEGNETGSVKVAKAPLSEEQRQAKNYALAVAELEKIKAAEGVTFPTRKEEGMALRADVRSLRRMLELYSPGFQLQLEMPIVGESNESLRDKRKLHVMAAESALKEYKRLNQAHDEPVNAREVDAMLIKQGKNRVLVSGIFFLCSLSLLWKDGSDRVIGLTELFALAGMWACAVYLWPNEFSKTQKKILAIVFKVISASVMLCAAIIVTMSSYALVKLVVKGPAENLGINTFEQVFYPALFFALAVAAIYATKQLYRMAMNWINSL